MKFTKFLALISLVVAVGAVQAQTVRYTFSGSVAGSLGGTTFSARDIVITAVGDISGITPMGAGLKNRATSNTLTISGIGSASFVGTFGVFMNNTNGIVGFWREGDLDVYDVKIGGTHDLTGPFGPKSGTVLGNENSAFATTQGDFIITSFASAGTYSVDAVPEPGTLLVLAGAGLAQAVARRRNRKSN